MGPKKYSNYKAMHTVPRQVEDLNPDISIPWYANCLHILTCSIVDKST